MLGRLPRFSTIGKMEKLNLEKALKRPLSGYLGGVHKGGYWVEKLTELWCGTFGCDYAVPCNSATSGLLAACMAAGVGPGDEVWVPNYTMSATAACAKVLGAKVKFVDIEPHRFSMTASYPFILDAPPKAIIITHLFGHPAYLKGMRRVCDDL